CDDGRGSTAAAATATAMASGRGALTVEWFQIMNRGAGRLRLASLVCVPVPSPWRFVRLLLADADVAWRQAERAAEERERALGEKAEVLETLRVCVDDKERMEQDLYGCFVSVLNAKKARIRELEIVIEGRCRCC